MEENKFHTITKYDCNKSLGITEYSCKVCNTKTTVRGIISKLECESTHQKDVETTNKHKKHEKICENCELCEECDLNDDEYEGVKIKKCHKCKEFICDICAGDENICPFCTIVVYR